MYELFLKIATLSTIVYPEFSHGMNHVIAQLEISDPLHFKLQIQDFNLSSLHFTMGINKK